MKSAGVRLAGVQDPTRRIRLGPIAVWIVVQPAAYAVCVVRRAVRCRASQRVGALECRFRGAQPAHHNRRGRRQAAEREVEAHPRAADTVHSPRAGSHQRLQIGRTIGWGPAGRRLGSTLQGTFRPQRSPDRGTATCLRRLCSTAHRSPPCLAACRCPRSQIAKSTARSPQPTVRSTAAARAGPEAEVAGGARACRSRCSLSRIRRRRTASWNRRRRRYHPRDSGTRCCTAWRPVARVPARPAPPLRPSNRASTQAHPAHKWQRVPNTAREAGRGERDEHRTRGGGDTLALNS
eukprot:7244435-Prymnesium_polylepis.1